MNASASGRVKTPAVVPTARTQLAPTALASFRQSSSARPVEQAGDVAGVEGVAAAGAVDEVDGIGAEADLEGVGDGDEPLLAAGDDDPAGAQVAERQGLADRVGLAQDQGGLVGVGQEDVGLGQDRAEVVEVVAGPGRGDVEDRDRPPARGPRRTARPGPRRRGRAGSGSRRGRATRGGGSSTASRSAAVKPRLAPKEWMNRRSWPRTLTISVWLVARSGSTVKAADVDAALDQGLGDEPAEGVVADLAADRRRATPSLARSTAAFGGAAADVQDQLVDRDQLAGGRAGGRSACRGGRPRPRPRRRRAGSSRRMSRRHGRQRSGRVRLGVRGLHDSGCVDRGGDLVDRRLDAGAGRACRSAPRSRRR